MHSRKTVWLPTPKSNIYLCGMKVVLLFGSVDSGCREAACGFRRCAACVGSMLRLHGVSPGYHRGWRYRSVLVPPPMGARGCCKGRVFRKSGPTAHICSFIFSWGPQLEGIHNDFVTGQPPHGWRLVIFSVIHWVWLKPPPQGVCAKMGGVSLQRTIAFDSLWRFKENGDFFSSEARWGVWPLSSWKW